MALIPDLTHEKTYTGKSEGQMPEGRHLMMVNYIDESKSGAGNRVHNVELIGVDTPNDGKVAKDNFTLSHEVGRARYKGFLMLLGFSNLTNVDTRDAQGLLIYVRVEHEPYTPPDRPGDTVMVAKAVAYRAIQRDRTPTEPAPVVGQREGAKVPAGKPTWREGAPAAVPAEKREYVSDEVADVANPDDF
jgi:hypothetical protein